VLDIKGPCMGASGIVLCALVVYDTLFYSGNEPDRPSRERNGSEIRRLRISRGFLVQSDAPKYCVCSSIIGDLACSIS